MDIRLIISNVAAAGILLIFSTALVTGTIPDSSTGLANMLIGASITYLFTENVVNGKSNKASNMKMEEPEPIPGVDDA